MTELRKENGDALEYVCPECGATFEEGAGDCGTCGMEFDWSEEMEYLCPECGTMVDPDQAQCPGCSAKFSTDEHGDVLIEYEPEKAAPPLDEMLATAIDEVRIRPQRLPEPMEEEPDESVDEETGPGGDPTVETEALEGTGPDDPAVGLEDIRLEANGDDVVATTRLYPGGFTTIGMAFVIMAVLALVFTVVMARYDTWIQGAAEETMGQSQRTLFIAGLLGFSASIMVAIYDLLRSPRDNEEEGTAPGHELVYEERKVDRTPQQ